MAKTTSTSKSSSAKSGTTKTSSAKSTSTRRRTAAAGKKTSRTRKTANETGGGRIILFYLIVIGLSIGSGSLLFYTSAIFPKMLYNQIKSDIIEIYQPSGCEDTQPKMPAVFKLDHVPTHNVQNRFVQTVRQHYGLDITFVKIADYDGKGINQIKFAKNGSEYGGVREIYIYWDKMGHMSHSIQSEKTDNMEHMSHQPQNEMAADKQNRNKEQKMEHMSHSSTQSPKPDTPKAKPAPKETAKDAALKEKNEIKSFEQRQKNITAPPKSEQPKVTEQPKQVEPASRVVPPHFAKLTIIIDDVGYAYEATDKFLALGVPITFAIIPETPRAAKYYQTIVDNNYEAIIHIPMEPEKGAAFVERNALLTSMSDIEIITNIQCFFMEMPACIGANNHMGSKAVADGHLMNVLIRSLAERDKLWVDSMTNVDTLSREFTSIYGLPDLHRDVFLDNQKD
ncbi:MAG: divergent polysaccharide deacetylase family protein, partial [Spirochaetales bacterium]|nr:divergent polysaccharide deacetylase family protein [Spirochaetales bacterium]